MSCFSDLVRVSKLETQFHSDSEYTQHVQYVSGSTPRQRSVYKEEKWRERGLGRGSFGIVWLERCILGDSEGKVRALKKLQKFQSSDCHRELEAIAFFSHRKVSLLLLLSTTLFPTPYAKFMVPSKNYVLSSPSAGMMIAIAYSSLWSTFQMAICKSTSGSRYQRRKDSISLLRFLKAYVSCTITDLLIEI